MDDQIWFGSVRNASLFMGVGIGAVGGMLLGLTGALAGILIPKRKGRKFLSGVFLFWMVAGGVSFVTGLVALFSGQPYAVYYPLLFFGIMASLVGWLLRWMQNRVYLLDSK